MFSVLVIRLRSLRLLRVSGIVMRLRKIGRRFSRNAETDLVCRLLLEKKKKIYSTDVEIKEKIRYFIPPAESVILVLVCVLIQIVYHAITFFALCFFFFNVTATTEIYTLSLHDALPILTCRRVKFL